MTYQHLGILEDHALDQHYVQNILRKPFTHIESSLNYDTKEKCGEYLQKYARKHDKKLFLFGYQAIGGSQQEVEGMNPHDMAQ